jgi:hypothetical protein
MRRRTVNGLGAAPAVPAAIPAENQGDYYEEAKVLVFKKSLAAQGTAGDGFPDLSQAIDKTYDFVWLGTAAISTGNFSVNFKDNGQRDIYTSLAQAANVIGTGQFPVDWRKPFTYPAGSRIPIALQNLTNAQNDIEISIIGIARYPTRNA